MEATSVRLSEATVNKIKKIKETTGLQTYNDVVFFILSKYEQETETEEKNKIRNKN